MCNCRNKNTQPSQNSYLAKTLTMRQPNAAPSNGGVPVSREDLLETIKARLKARGIESGLADLRAKYEVAVQQKTVAERNQL